MCGIAGKIYLDKDRSVDLEEVKIMTDCITHRGPDDEGHYLDNNAGLGFRRLSIIDLKDGHQPLCDNSERFWITFNGEIYNFQELRMNLRKKGYFFRTNTDTEVIVNLYAEYKEKCLDHLRGMFAFVIWDSKEKELFGARDRFGIKPFYYYLDDDKFMWGSEMKSITASKHIKKEINLESLDHYFTYGYTPRERSIFTQIIKLKAGHCFTFAPFKRNKLQIKPYWNICFAPDYSKTESYWKEAIFDTLSESVKMRMISDVPLGAFLSGGVDSSIVAALMSLNSSSPIKTFSIGFKEEKYNELKYAKLVADKFKTQHMEYIVESESIDLIPKLVSAYDEPFADASSIPTYYVSKFTRKNVTVALSGDGGDELFGGYNRYSKMINLNKNKYDFPKFFKQLNRVIPDHLYGKGLTYYLSKDKDNIAAYFCLWRDYERQKFYQPDMISKLKGYSSEGLMYNDLYAFDGDFMSRIQQLDMKNYLVEDILQKVDRASMLNSLEVRVPLLDHKFAELSFRIPWEMKIKNGYKKYILKESFKHVLPSETLSHKKQGFAVPLSTWFRGDLKDYAYDNLANSKNLFDFVKKEHVLNLLKNHQKGVRDYGNKIWSLLFLNEWLKQNQQ